MSSVLFICKSGLGYSSAYPDSKQFSGLANSARLVSDMLNLNNISSVVEVAVDNNDIDRLVTLHNPEYCIIEAYWVIPSKFEVLTKLHPKVKWLIRIHSETPFWATEGIAMEWTNGYLEFPQITLAPNSQNLYRDLQTIGGPSNIVYLPNFYPINLYKDQSSNIVDPEAWNVGCFGAIRPLKNQLIQAISAINYANLRDRKLHFHINGNRIEGGGEPVLKNIRSLFASNPKHTLVEHDWMPHSKFIDLISSMDLGMQVSFTESFNIVAADFVSQNRPIVTSAEISFIAKPFHTITTNSREITKAIYRAEVLGKRGTFLNKYLLQEFSSESQKLWLDYIEPMMVE